MVVRLTPDCQWPCKAPQFRVPSRTVCKREGTQALKRSLAAMWDAALEVAAARGEADIALQLLAQMKERGVPTGYVAHGCVLRALCAADRTQVCRTPRPHHARLGRCKDVLCLV